MKITPTKIALAAIVALGSAIGISKATQRTTPQADQPIEATASAQPTTDRDSDDPAPPTEADKPRLTQTDAPLMASKIRGEIILARQGYTCSYNPTTRQPNYVAWTLTPTKLEGTVKRSQQFYEDPDLSDDQKSLLDDYYNSGYDRGHMCPAADNKWSTTAMMESFYLSNMCPQTHTLNAGDWEQLESATRRWVQQQGTTLYICCGPIFVGTDQRKLNRRLPVPDRFFKAIVNLTPGQERGIAFIYDNNTDSHPMDYYVCTIDQVEKATGLNLFADLPSKLEKLVEGQADITLWEKGKGKKKKRP